MKRVLTIALASAGLALSAAPASAAVNYYQCGVNAPAGSSCISDTNNVNLTTANGVGGPGQGTTGVGMVVPSGPGVTFTTTDNGGLNLDANGQAVITAVDGRLNNLTVNLLSGNITQAEFNLVDIGNQDFDVLIQSLFNGAVTTTSSTFNATFNGSNRFGITATDGSILTGFTITSNTGFGALTQLRLTAGNMTSAVPEPATWAMMLLGFGGMGLALRRRRRVAPRHLAQIA